MKPTRTTVLAAALLFGGAACADLDIENPNAPDRERALAEPSDVESLISGSFNRWWNTQGSHAGFRAGLSAVGFNHSATPANFGMVEFSQLPRQPLNNSTAWSFYSEFANTWEWSYEAAGAVREGLIAMGVGPEADPEEAVELAEHDRALAFARFVQGLAHGTVAQLFDQGYIYDETVPLDPDNPAEIGDPIPYDQVMDQALDYLAEAAQVASESDFTLPDTWMSLELTSDELAEYAHAWRARFATTVARTPEERAQVDWDQVLDDIEAAGDTDKTIRIGGDLISWGIDYGNLSGWSQMNYHFHGMADQSGDYQDWIETPPMEREAFIMETPDLRFPRGSTREEQEQGIGTDEGCVNMGIHWTIPGCVDGGASVGDQWSQAARGTWRWSYYRDWRYWRPPSIIFSVREHPELAARELRLLEAEALYRQGDEGAAVEIIDETRTEIGGLGTAADNADCVPRLPAGADPDRMDGDLCGDVLEALKWEWRTELAWKGFGTQYFASRGWGDLPEGTFLNLPVPQQDAELFGLEVYTTGGVGGNEAAPVGGYGF